TEWGVIWGYEGKAVVPQPDGSYATLATGRFRSDLIGAYLDDMFSWLTVNSETLRIDRWFLYATSPGPEFYTSTPTTISLLQPVSTTLTPFGERFRGWATNTATRSYYFPWYDSLVTNGSDWILVANPDSTTSAQVKVTIAGVPRGTYSIPPGGRVTPSYPGVM